MEPFLFLFLTRMVSLHNSQSDVKKKMKNGIYPIVRPEQRGAADGQNARLPSAVPTADSRTATIQLSAVSSAHIAIGTPYGQPTCAGHHTGAADTTETDIRSAGVGGDSA